MRCRKMTEAEKHRQTISNSYFWPVPLPDNNNKVKLIAYSCFNGQVYGWTYLLHVIGIAICIHFQE